METISMTNLDKEPRWGTNLRILLKNDLYRSTSELVDKYPFLESELVTLIEDEDEKVRENAVRGLCQIKNSKKHFQTIKKALKDQNPRVRIAAAGRITQVSRDQSRLPLIELLYNEQDEGAILSALDSLKDVGKLEDTDAIIPFLKYDTSSIANRARTALIDITARH